MRTLVIGDIHGAIKALTQVLERADIQSTDHLIFLGDYADGWSQTPEVLDFLISYQHQQRCLFLRGNHDALCYDFLQGKNMDILWRLHGGKATEKAYQNVTETRRQAHLDFLASLQNYYLDAQNRLFLHAGFTNLRGIAYEHFPEMYYWDRTLWELAQSSTLPPTDPHYPNRLKLYTHIYIGHTPTTRLGTDKPLSFNGVTNVDTGAAFKGRITIMDIDTLQYWQSDPVYTLYPDEAGRNQ
ncbi:MAG: serine/threonine protein phosphatase [Capnocytophaga sp.]|nr:metallophosphoesterase [Capnocytophaga sp.]MBB1568011.1 serine/threonine protein phosphatase [Capnocytophaga sp.]